MERKRGLGMTSSSAAADSLGVEGGEMGAAPVIKIRVLSVFGREPK